MYYCRTLFENSDWGLLSISTQKIEIITIQERDKVCVMNFKLIINKQKTKFFQNKVGKCSHKFLLQPQPRIKNSHYNFL